MRALVTGVSRGIGRAICLRLAADSLARGDAETVIVATGTGKSPDLEETVDALKAMGAKSIALTGDLTTEEDPERITREAIDFCGGLDALVNNAGFPVVGKLMDVKIRHWDKMFNINCRSTLIMGRAAHAALSQSRGSICVTSSNAATHPSRNLTGYSASKAAVNMLVQQMAYEWGPDGIRANSVSPGPTASRSTEKAYTPEAIAQRSQPLPLRRIGQPEDIAAAVGFLVGPDAAFITGIDVSVDGGQRLITIDAMLREDVKYS